MSNPYAVSVFVCSECGEPWEEHLERARERMKESEPERFFTSPAGIEYPTVNSLLVRNSVTEADCKQLSWACCDSPVSKGHKETCYVRRVAWPEP